jgi:hypothetical protein
MNITHALNCTVVGPHPQGFTTHILSLYVHSSDELQRLYTRMISKQLDCIGQVVLHPKIDMRLQISFILEQQRPKSEAHPLCCMLMCILESGSFTFDVNRSKCEKR